MSIVSKLQEALALAGRPDGNPRWWLAPDGELKPCSEHEYSARAVLRGLGVVPAPGRKLYDQMFDRGWVRVVGEQKQIHFEVSRSHVREATEIQLRSLKALALECGLGLYDATANRAVALGSNDPTPKTPRVILHIPHSSRLIPENVRPSLLLSDEALEHELLRMTDSFTDELFALEPSLATSVIFPVSRLVVDPERFTDDSMESMAGRGMGAVYTKTSSGSPLRGALSDVARNLLLKRYYWPHHEEFSEKVSAAVEVFGNCLIMDCHSFSSRPLPHEPDQQDHRPEICIGTDEYHTPAALAHAATRLFRQAGFETEVNRPFSGAFVPSKFYRTDPRVHSIMVEINRGTYMNEETGERHPAFDQFLQRLQHVLRSLVQISGSSRSRQPSQR